MGDKERIVVNRQISVRELAMKRVIAPGFRKIIRMTKAFANRKLYFLLLYFFRNIDVI